MIRAIHITEPRAALADAYVAAGLAAPSYTDPILSTAIGVRVVHITELPSAVITLE